MRKPRKPQRLLYRSGLTNDELDRLVAEIGLRRLLMGVRPLDRPRLHIRSVTLLGVARTRGRRHLFSKETHGFD
jgi:hypothetical protein